MEGKPGMPGTKVTLHKQELMTNASLESLAKTIRQKNEEEKRSVVESVSRLC